MVRVRLWLTIGIAAFSLIATAVFVAMNVHSHQQVIAVLPRADGVRVGAPVTYRGLNIGNVENLRIDRGRVIAELRIRRADGKIRQDDTLRVRSVGIFGDVSLDFTPGDASAPFLESTDTLLVITRGG